MASSAFRPGRRSGAALALAIGALVGALAGAAPARAQGPPRATPGGSAEQSGEDRPPTLPDGTRRVRGRIVTPRDSALRPVSGAWVTLHRVAADRAGPLDSVRTRADGAFAFTYRPIGAANAIYFVSTQYGGIAYFSAPLRDAVVEGERAEVIVFDTTSAPVPVAVSGRHVAVSRGGADGAREVLDVYELTNNGERTGVPDGRTGGGVWSAPLPAGATGFAVRAGGDVPADGMAATGGRAVLLSPLAPGLKQVAFSYKVPGSRFPLDVPVGTLTGVLEVLVEDPRGAARGAKLVQTSAASVEGHTFHRFLAQDVPAGARVTVDVPAGPTDAWPRWAVPALIVGVGGAMTAGWLVAYQRRAARRPVATAPTVAIPAPVPSADFLLAELAALDDAHAAGGRDEAAYDERRAELKRRVAERLAAKG